MRIRSLIPDFTKDQRVQSWPPLARLVFATLPMACDDSGRFEADTAILRALLTPKDRQAEFDLAFRTIVDSGRVAIWEVEGESFGVVVNFPLYQRVEKPQPCLTPAPPEEIACAVAHRVCRNSRWRERMADALIRMVGEHSGKIRGIIGEYSPNIPRSFQKESAATRARAEEQGAGSREEGIGPPNPRREGVVVGEWIREFWEGLKGTGKFPALTLEGVALYVRGWPAAEGWWREVVQAAVDHTGVIGAPHRWIPAQFAAMDLEKKKTARTPDEEVVVQPRGAYTGPAIPCRKPAEVVA